MRIWAGLFLLVSFVAQADTMDHYINITNQIPQMEMKADPQAQSWARSARNVMILTNESIAETLLQANELARSQGRPLFCLPPGVTLNANTMNDLIVRTYRELSSQQSDKDRMTVSQMAWLAVGKSYPCQTAQTNGIAGMNNTAQQIQHASASGQ